MEVEIMALDFALRWIFPSELTIPMTQLLYRVFRSIPPKLQVSRGIFSTGDPFTRKGYALNVVQFLGDDHWFEIRWS